MGAINAVVKNGEILMEKDLRDLQIPVVADKSDDYENPYWLCPKCGAILTELDDEFAEEIHNCNYCGQSVKFK